MLTPGTGDDQDMLVIVPDDQLPLPSAKKGKTLAWRQLSGCKIDIKSESQAEEFFREIRGSCPAGGGVNSGQERKIPETYVPGLPPEAA